MADVVSNRGESGQVATEIPSRYLPAVTYADLPEPVPLKKVFGPSVLLLAAAIGSGEYVLWPYIASQTGMALVWVAIIGITTQYFINMEIERYTLATGETAVTGFTRLWKHWSWLFIVMTVVPWALPGWATGGATALGFVFGWGESAIVPVTIAVLVLMGLVLTTSPVVYQTVEKVQFFLVGLIVLFLVYTALVLLGLDGWLALGEGLTTEIPKIPGAIGDVGWAVLVGAIAFAGAGGSVNLVQSNWIRDKGLGMGVRIPRIVSPLTGEEEASASTGYMFPQDERNTARWHAWWRLAHREQFGTFLIIGGLTIVLLMTLTFVTLGVGGDASSFDFIHLQGEALGDSYGSWLSTAFWLTGVVVLLSTNLAVLDMVGRVVADVLKVGPLRGSTRWSESKVYAIVVWAEIVVGSVILLSGFYDALILLVIASSLNAVVMFVYSALLIKLNRNVLPEPARLGGPRLKVMMWAVLFYGICTVGIVYSSIDSVLASL